MSEEDTTPQSPPSTVYGEVTGQLWEVFKSYMSENRVLLHRKIRSVLNSIGLFPTHSQIHELVHVACEQSGRVPVDHITFGEFCFFVTELREHYRLNIPGSLPRSQLKQKAVLALEERRLQRRFSGHAAGFQVFLGGSCNPTTWRHDIAIPFLKKHGITFYNPQVSNWRPELMEMEDQAKQTAELLFFVVDNQTRSTASMVEAAYIGGCGRQLILVIKKFQMPITIYNELLLESEIEDLERSHVYLTDLIERMSIPVFSDIETALNCTRKAVQQNVKVSELFVDDGALPVKFPHARVASELYKVKDVFNTIDTSRIGKLSSAQDIQLAFKTVTNEDLPLCFESDHMFTFEDFCCLLSEYRYRRKGMLKRFWSGLIRLPTRILNWYHGHLERRRSEREPRRRDVFLGGSCGNSSWRDEIAIPLLMKHGISYYNPQLECWNTYCIPLEAAIKDGCQLLLFVITEDTRAMTSMIEAGFFIGQGCNIVLCIQDMKYGINIDDELTENAVDDYNRARTYLADLANRDGVPVLNNIVEAVNCVVTRLKEIRESEYAAYT